MDPFFKNPKLVHLITLSDGGGIVYTIFISSCNEKIRVIYEFYYNAIQNYDIKMKKIYVCIYIYIQGVPGGMCQTSVECSLC